MVYFYLVHQFCKERRNKKIEINILKKNIAVRGPLVLQSLQLVNYVRFTFSDRSLKKKKKKLQDQRIILMQTFFYFEQVLQISFRNICPTPISLCSSPIKIHQCMHIEYLYISWPFQINDLKWPLDDLWHCLCGGDMWLLPLVSLCPSSNDP